MSYLPDLKSLTVDDYQNHLVHKNLLPGRIGLLENIKERFDSIRRAGILNVDSLLKTLSTPQKLARFSTQTLIPEPYLVLLKREIGSLLPKITPIKELLGVDESTSEYLFALGIKATKDYYEAYLAGGLGALPQEVAKDLFAQCDVVRINGMGPLAAKLFIAAGYDSCEAIANADADSMFERVTTENTDNAFYTGPLGLKDIQFCIDNARFLVKYT